MRILMIPLLAALLSACQSAPERPPVQLVDHLDLDRLVGDRYVIANIPTPFEKGNHYALQQYQRVGPREVAVTFSYNEDDFTGERETMSPTGYVSEDNNAVWGMRFIWPLKSDYRVMYVDDDYQTTVIGRQKRDYLWIMARTPSIDNTTLERLIDLAEANGYERNKIQRVPQRWPSERQQH